MRLLPRISVVSLCVCGTRTEHGEELVWAVVLWYDSRVEYPLLFRTSLYIGMYIGKLVHTLARLMIRSLFAC